MLSVDTASPVPTYEQLRVQLRALIESGVLAPDVRLPAIRQLAGDLGLAPNTVQRAYRELEADGLIEARGRHGTVVLAGVAAQAPKASPALALSVEQLVVRARDAGMSLEELVHAVRVCFVRVAAR